MRQVLWCEQAWVGDETATYQVLIEIEGERIAKVVAGVPAPTGAKILLGLTLPGFANTHSHAFHRVLRGATHQGKGDFWAWREEMYRAAGSLDPDSYHRLATDVYREMVASGYTSVGEFHYLHHGPEGRRYSDPNAMSEALVAAAREAGIRLTLIDALYLHGGLDGRYLPLSKLQRRFSDGTAADWAERVGGWTTDVQRGVAVHSVRAVDPEAMETVRRVAAGLGCPVHAHVSERPMENAAAIDLHGRTPTGLLADAGLVDDRFTAVHGTHLGTGDIRLLGGARSFVSFCPTTERDLGDGIGPSRALLDAGARITIGSDSQAVIDPFEETRAVELNQRLVTLERGIHTIGELLAAATVNGHTALGYPRVGRIETGWIADLVTIGFTSRRLRHIDPPHRLAAAVFAASPGDVTSVIIGGRALDLTR